MKIKIVSIILVTILFSCSPGNQTNEKGNEVTMAPATDTTKTETKSFANIMFTSRFDTSCGMPLSAGIEDTLQLNGKVYGFCSKECKDDFVNKLKTGTK